MIIVRVHFDTLDRTPEDSFLFLAHPGVPGTLKPADIAPQFCSESLRIDALRAGRRPPLIERFLDSQPFNG